MANTAGMEAIVEIDENERYWVGHGFGKVGLLPNDRGAFSTTDGTIFWNSTKEASEDLLLLGRGWKYKDETDEDGGGGDFKPTPRTQIVGTSTSANASSSTAGAADESGWMYAPDFRPESIVDAKPNRGALHWVRFRRLIRVKVFNPEEFVSVQVYNKCDHCDSNAIESVSKVMLDVLSYCSLLHNKQHVTDAILLPLKKTVTDMAISQEVTTTTTNDKQQQQQPPHDDVFYQLDLLRKKLENFVEKERSHTVMARLFSGVDFTYYGRENRKEFKDRREAVSARCFHKEERDAIAGLIVRKLDPHFQLHCDQTRCGSNCRFQHVKCPNAGCPTKLSKIHVEAHEETCPFKIIHCECGDSFKVQELPNHRSQACKFRIVPCPFRHIGCLKEMKVCDLAHHITNDTGAHLLLAVDQMDAQQEAMKMVHSKLNELEKENKELARQLEAHKEESQSTISELQKEITKTNKELHKLEQSCQKEFKRLNSTKQQLS